MDSQSQPLAIPPIPVSSIPERFFLDVAIGVQSFEDICALYELNPTAAAALETDPKFQHRLLIAKQAVEDTGRAFRARCRTLVHESLGHMERLLTDPDTPASTQLETFKTLVKYGEMEPAVKKEQNDAPQVSLTIIAPDGSTAFSFDAGVRADEEDDPNLIEDAQWEEPDDSPETDNSKGATL